MNIVVYTALFGECDRLWSPQPLAVGGCRHVCFSEKPRRQVGLWQNESQMKPGTGDMGSPPVWEVKVVPKQGNDRLSARHYKTLPHRYLPDADITIWVDGNIRLLVTPQYAVGHWLKGGQLAIFNHHDRDCLYDEAKFCLRVPRGVIYKQELAQQTAAYRSAGMPAHWGLAETRCVIRMKGPKVQEMGELWWSEIQAHSPRDQVSLPYVCWKVGLRWNVIPGRVRLFRSPGGATGQFWCLMHGHTL